MLNFVKQIINFILINIFYTNLVYSGIMEVKGKFKPNPEYRLMDRVREILRYYHYSYKTEKIYSSWILRYVKFYGSKTHPKDMGKNEVDRFLSYLTGKRMFSQQPGSRY